MIKRNNKKSRSDVPAGCSKDNLQEKIRNKAYELFLKRGCSHGNDLADWIEAERTVKQQQR